MACKWVVCCITSLLSTQRLRGVNTGSIGSFLPVARTSFFSFAIMETIWIQSLAGRFSPIKDYISPAGWCCAVLGCYLVPKGRAAWILGSSEWTSGCVDIWFSDKNTNIWNIYKKIIFFDSIISMILAKIVAKILFFWQQIDWFGGVAYYHTERLRDARRAAVYKSFR